MRTKATILLTILLVAFGASGISAATLIDLDANPFGATNDGALFFSGPLPTATGTGLFNPFLRVSVNDAIEQGYNTDFRGKDWPDFNQDPSWTKALKLSEVPTVKYDGNSYREFILDVNQIGSGNGIMISLDELALFASSSNLLSSKAAVFAASPIWEMGDYYVKINASKSSGSGSSDVTLLVPESKFAGFPDCQYGSMTCNTYLYFWTLFGKNFGNNDGFEEWATLVRPTVAVSKTANTSYTQAYNWEIAKSVDPAAWKLFTGESGESKYTVSVVKTPGAASNFVVSGNITILNTTESQKVDTIIKSVEDLVGAASAAVTCPVTLPYSMKKNETVVCTYTATLPGATPTTTGTNTATVTLSDDSTFTGSAGYDFADATVTKVNDSITVNDTFGGPWTTSASTSWTYNKWFACDANKGVTNNTATIVGLGKSASAAVTVDCYQLKVEKDVTTYWERKWDWMIAKTGDQTYLKLMPGEKFPVNYEVVVDAAKTDFGFKASGNIKVSNSAPIDAWLTGVKDIISPDLAATVTCNVTFPYKLEAGKDLNCTYTRDLPDAVARTNTATGTQQLYKYPFGLAKVADGTKDYADTKPVAFKATPDKEWDECIDVTDSLKGALGKVCAGVDTLPKKFTYSLTVGPYALEQCGMGPYDFKNCASFVTNDWQKTGESCWIVKVDVPCPGCTLTQGYWKTHSSFGNATIDEEIYKKTWGSGAALIPQGEDTPFFHSGQSWGEVMWTPPAKGNAYYILAHQWIAAYLNVLNGASLPTAVATAWNDALAEFQKPMVTPAYLLTDDAADLRAKFIMWAGILGSYNEGMEGVPHCSY